MESGKSFGCVVKWGRIFKPCSTALEGELGRSHSQSWGRHLGICLAAPRDAWNCSCPATFVNLNFSSFLSWQLTHCTFLFCTSSWTLCKDTKTVTTLRYLSNTTISAYKGGRLLCGLTTRRRNTQQNKLEHKYDHKSGFNLKFFTSFVLCITYHSYFSLVMPIFSIFTITFAASISL